MNKFSYLIIFLLYAVNFLKSQDIPCNDENALLYDGAKVLKTSEKKLLKQRLDKLSDSLSIKIYFVFIDSFNGLEKEEYIKKIIEEWDILEDQNAKEMLILTAVDQKKIIIELTSALKKKFSETAALDIMDNLLGPAFVKKEYSKGTNKAIDEILKYINGYYSGGAYSPNYDHSLDRKWYLLQSYDKVSLMIILGMALIFNVFVYVKFLSKPLGIYLLYQTLWHLLGSLNIFFYTILIMKDLDPDLSVYVFNVLFVVLQIIVLLKSEGLFSMKRYLKIWIIMFVASWILADLAIIYINYSALDDIESFLPYIYYGFLFNFILFSVGLIFLFWRNSKKAN